MLETCKGAALLVSELTDDGCYLRFQVEGRFGVDLVEFLVKDTISDVNVTEPVVFFRSLARNAHVLLETVKNVF